MPTFWVGGQIKAKLTKLFFRCHMPATGLYIINATRSRKQIQQAHQKKD